MLYTVSLWCLLILMIPLKDKSAPRVVLFCLEKLDVDGLNRGKTWEFPLGDLNL